jgi:2-keto-4-pentenoate hydratase
MADERMAGLARQLEELERRRVAGETLGGWKVGLTSGAARDQMGAGFRPFGFILASRILESGASVELASGGPFGIENELCFTIGSTVAPDVSADDVAGALSAVSPAYEIIERRTAGQVSVADRLADNLSQWGIVVGASRAVDEVPFADLVVSLARDSETVQTVAARGHIDNHFASIAALAAQLAEFGRALEPGQRVITGSYTKQAVSGPSRWTGSFGSGFEDVEVVFR